MDTQGMLFLGVVFVIFNNTSYRILKQRVFAQRGYAAQLDTYVGMELNNPEIDYVGLARSLGVDAQHAASLHDATQRTLREWIDRLRADAAGEFPEHVTAFREGMAVHGRFKKPCPVCGSPVQRTNAVGSAAPAFPVDAGARRRRRRRRCRVPARTSIRRPRDRCRRWRWR